MRPRRKKARLPRGQSVPPTLPVDLFLLAGLPYPLHFRAVQLLEQIGAPYAKVIAVGSANRDGVSLFGEKIIDVLLRGTAQFAIRRLKNRAESQPPRPRRIALFYVPSGDYEHLLAAFDFFVFPVPLRELAEFDENGHQKRHQLSACERALRAAFAVYSRDLLGNVQYRVESRRASEGLLLPPINFHARTGRLQTEFCEFTRGIRSWESAVPEGIAAETFGKEALPDFIKRDDERLLIYRDARDVVFPSARSSELHGRFPELESAAEVAALKDLLQSAYRFGTPLPEGFHHDAQFEGGRHFDKTEFVCSRNGTILVSASHANIYPNDYVRADT
jgi:hypothetical protein